MTILLVCLLGILRLSFAEMVYPEGYYLEVELACNYMDVKALFVVRTNLSQVITSAWCVDTKVPFQRAATNLYHLFIYYGTPDPNQDKKCYFWGNGDVNTVPVLVSWASGGWFQPTIQKHYKVVCQRNIKGQSRSGTLRDPVTRRKDHAGDTEDSVVMKVMDVYGHQIKPAFLMGKLRLKADILGESSSSGMMALTCVAIAASNVTSYNFITGGCGDGLVVPKTDGFYSRGRSVLSPEIHFSRIKGLNFVRLVCNFSVCPHGCDGNNCVDHHSNIGRKRHARDISRSLFDSSMHIITASVDLLERKQRYAPEDASSEEIERGEIPLGLVSVISQKEFYNLESFLRANGGTLHSDFGVSEIRDDDDDDDDDDNADDTHSLEEAVIQRRIFPGVSLKSTDVLSLRPGEIKGKTKTELADKDNWFLSLEDGELDDFLQTEFEDEEDGDEDEKTEFEDVPIETEDDDEGNEFEDVLNENVDDEEDEDTEFEDFSIENKDHKETEFDLLIVDDKDDSEGNCGENIPASVTSRLIVHSFEDPHDTTPYNFIALDVEQAPDFLLKTENDYERPKTTTKSLSLHDDPTFVIDNGEEPELLKTEHNENNLKIYRYYMLSVVAVVFVIFGLCVLSVVTLIFKMQKDTDTIV